MKTLQTNTLFDPKVQLVNAPIPEPGPRQVLVKVRAVSLNRRDLAFYNRSHPARPNHPIVACSDMAGRVVARGSNVDWIEPGTPVVTTFLPKWDRGPPTAEVLVPGFGGPRDGVAAQFRVFDRLELVASPPAHLNAFEAACLPCAGVTAWSAVTACGPLSSDKVIVIPGTGGVSCFAIQFARAFGARVIGLTSRDDKGTKLAALGVSDIVNYRRDHHWGLAVRELCNGRGADLVLDYGTSRSFENAVEAVGVGGVICVIGGLSNEPLSVSPTTLLTRSIRIQGITAGSHAAMRAMFQFIDAHGIKPIHETPWPLADADKAFQRLEHGDNVGKVCISIDHP